MRNFPVACPFVEAVLMLVLGVEAADVEDSADLIDANDSLESCLFNDSCSDGLLGGRLGADLSDGLLEGKAGRGSSSRPSHFFITGAGSSSFCGASGLLPTSWPNPPFVFEVGMFVEAERFAGRGGGGGLAFFTATWSREGEPIGIDARPILAWSSCKAAIRSRRVGM